jgi:pimeloyl-ACP methyl ester carboxylesterase
MQRSNWSGPARRRASLGSALVFAGVIAMGGHGLAAEPIATAKVPNIVLVHGAWADGSSWSGVIQRLQQAGYHVMAVQLALRSLDDDVKTTRGVLALQTGPTLLVAHSYGGAVITMLGADAPHVVGLVYESAFAPDQGESLKALTSQPPPPPGAVAIRPDKQGLLWLDPAGLMKFFASDVPPEQSGVMAATQKPISGAAFTSDEKFGPPAWRSFPTWFLISEKDQMIPPAAQHLFAKRMGATVSSIAGSHVLMVSHPDEVAGFIMKASQEAAKKVGHASK